MPSEDLRAPLSGFFSTASNPSQAETEQIVDLSIREMISFVYTPALLSMKAVAARLPTRQTRERDLLLSTGSRACSRSHSR